MLSKNFTLPSLLHNPRSKNISCQILLEISLEEKVSTTTISGLLTGRTVKVKVLWKAISSTMILRWPPSNISISMVHIQVHAECPYQCCMPMPMLNALVHAACPFPCCMPMSMLHLHDHAVCPCSCYMFMPMLHALAHVACLYSCCMHMPMMHVNAASWQTVALCTAEIAAFCKG